MSCLCCQGYGPVRDDHDDHDDHDHDHDGDACGCGAEAHDHAHGHDHGGGGGSIWRSETVRAAILYAIALQAAAVASRFWPEWEIWAYAAAMAVGLVPVVGHALASARRGNPFSIEALMSIAAIGALLIGAVVEAATVVLLFLVGEILETLAARRAQAGIRRLVALVPQTALVETDAGTETVAAAALVPGMTIVVGAGERIAADGEVTAGQSGVDESPLTGESLPKSKAPGDLVFAGTINGDGVLRVRVTAGAADTAIARVVRLVREAQARKAPVERLIDRFARVYTPCVVGIGAAVAILPPLFGLGTWDTWIYRGLALLLIGCPCAMVISTPAALASALAAGAGRGLLIKGGEVLESLSTVTEVALDKTGTLTRGRPAVTDVVAFDADAETVLAVAAGLSLGAAHPMARAIREAAEQRAVVAAVATDVANLPGQGVGGSLDGAPAFIGALRGDGCGGVSLSAERLETARALMRDGKTVSAVMRDGAPLGLIAVRDDLRDDAAAGIADLRGLGMRITMLTGDAADAAEAVARKLDIDFRANLLPGDKLDAVRGFQAAGGKVAKVGDGINDAPALAAAEVGIAFGGGTDVALETADAASLHGRVRDVAAMIVLARRAMATIRQNIGIAIGLKGLFLITTVIGVTGLWPAVLADTGATVLVTANALRLLRR